MVGWGTMAGRGMDAGRMASRLRSGELWAVGEVAWSERAMGVDSRSAVRFLFDSEGLASWLDRARGLGVSCMDGSWHQALAREMSGSDQFLSSPSHEIVETASGDALVISCRFAPYPDTDWAVADGFGDYSPPVFAMSDACNPARSAGRMAARACAMGIGTMPGMGGGTEFASGAAEDGSLESFIQCARMAAQVEGPGMPDGSRAVATV